MTDLKSILPLYIGKDFIYSGTKDETRYELNYERLGMIVEEDDLLEIKLILRPLSDIKETESEKWFDAKDLANKDVATVYEEQAQRTLYLLQQGFDLFNLHEIALCLYRKEDGSLY